MNSKSILAFALFLSACGGGGGGGAPAVPVTPAASVNLSADPSSVLLTNTTTLTWSTSNATSCSASGAWSGTKATSGTEVVTISTAGDNSFTLSCTGAGGSGSASVTVEGFRNTDGVVVDGYISGAEVFIDEDDDWVADSNESSTTSDNDGKFTIKYANGNLVSIGGTDLDSQTLLDNLLITHKLTGHSDFKAVTPVTSVAAFMTDAANVNAALGIDSTIDIAIFDPVANKGDGGANDYLYEKGNQLTVLAYALQNITNDLNTTTETTQDYFKAITEEVEKEYTETTTKVDIETEEFITKTLDNIVEAKSVTITDEAKANTTKALSGVMPVIEVKSSDDLTTSVIRFAVSTLQTDIQAIANGTASAETVASYTNDVLTYIATDQSIDANDITPDITAIADSATTSEDTAVDINVLVNDSFVTTAPITVTAANGSNGSTAITANIVSYTPNTDFNGTDTFSYTITQGDKTSSADVTVTIEAVNDAPSIDTASTIQVAENQTAVTTISVSDVDEDDLTLTLSGTDADSFNLSTDNVLTFKEAPDFETKSSYSITLSLTDGTETVTKDMTIAITNLNDIAPVFTSEATFSAAENQTAIGTITATDADGDSVTFTVSGSELVITSAGVLTFASAPDYEIKSIYSATVTATDGTNPTTQDITVNITNLNDTAPVFTSEATFSAAENQTAIGMVTATDADGDAITFTISGTELAITSAGVLTFISAPDYETKTTYMATVTASDVINTVDQDITVNVTDISEGTTFSGEAIDGYISGANVFIDENFNFNKDVGEFSATTDTNGQFQIQVASNTKAACLRNRPIIANVPIGAIDSTYGNVTEAYQMLLPSINDAGIDKIVISPFTTLLSEAIIQGKIASNLDQDLTLEEGCGTKGNNVQTQVSSKITTLINDLENTYGFTYKQLIADFIEGDTPYGESHLFYENNARNLAGYYPTIKNIQDIISDDFSSNLGIEVTANLSLSKNAIDSIFSGDDEIANSNKLPLEFTATYLTSKDSNNWYQDEFMKANGAKIDANDNVYRHDYCPSGFATSDCVKNLSLQAIKDMSSTYEQRSEWRNDNIPANAIPGINAGTIEFSVIDKRNFDATEGQLKCNLDEILKFDEVDGDFENEYQYRPQIGIDDNSAGTYAGFKLKKCGFTNSSKSVAINVERVKADTNEIVGTSYRTNSKARSRIISTSTPHNLIDNKGSFDPLDVIREISQIPWKLSDVEKMRSLLGYNENVNIFFKESNEIGGTRRSISLTALPWKDNYTDDNNVEFLGIDARTKFFEAINAWNPAAKLNLDSTYLGGSSFPESKALFRLSSQGAYTFQVGNPDERIWIVPEIEFSGNTTYMLGNFYGQNIDLETLQDIAKNGIGTKTVSVNGSLEINGDISGTLPIKLYLYEGSDDILNAGEGYFSIETNISFSPTNDPQGRTDNNLRDGIRRAMRLTLAAGEEIKFTFNDSNGTKIEKTIINNDIDTNIIEDESGSINIPTSLVDKVLVALNAIGLDYSNAIAEFFKEQGQYTYKITFGDYFIMPWDFTYSNAIKGTFTVASDPSVAVYWSGGLLYIGENTSQNLCFHTNKSNPEDITISLAPIFGSGPGYADSSDFTISKTSITIPATTGSSQQQCTTITALRDDVLGESYDKFDIKYDVTGAVRATNELIEVILRDF